VAAPESKAEQAIEALCEQLAANMIADGAVYHYNAVRVLRYPTWQGIDLNQFVDDPEYPLGGDGALILVRPGMEVIAEEASGQLLCELDVYLVIAAVYQPTSEDGSAEPVLEQTVQNRLVRDVLKAVFEDVSLGGAADVYNARVSDVDRASHYVEGWAIVELTLRIQYGPNRENP
jgi:hypothetical protein